LSMIKEVTDEDGDVVYEVWQCPKGPQCKHANSPPERQMFRKPNSGFVNLFKHLCHCFDNEENLQKMYERAKMIQEEDGDEIQESLVATGNLGTYFKSASAMTSGKAQAYYTWIYWIIMKNMPLTSVKDTHHRNFSQIKTKISYKSVVKVIGKLVELVEQKIKTAINLSKSNHGCGAILYGGWDGGSEHYVGLFLSFTPSSLSEAIG
jgi:hypothetical protein